MLIMYNKWTVDNIRLPITQKIMYYNNVWHIFRVISYCGNIFVKLLVKFENCYLGRWYRIQINIQHFVRVGYVPFSHSVDSIRDAHFWIFCFLTQRKVISAKCQSKFSKGIQNIQQHNGRVQNTTMGIAWISYENYIRT